MKTKLVLIRHGETAWNAEHRIQGHASQHNPRAFPGALGGAGMSVGARHGGKAGPTPTPAQGGIDRAGLRV